MPATLDDLLTATLKFRDDRNWSQFHTPKELALCLTLESAEVVELMQWKQGDDLQRHLAERKEALADELSDVLHALLLLAHDQHIDLGQAYLDKMKKNELKYPIDKAKNQAKKYTEL